MVVIGHIGTSRWHHRNGGFTLIELLVVIVILGVISGVVVFAVRGTGDKGEANAVAADRRTVRTAQEAFCARYGRYARSMDELVDGPRNASGEREGRGFLSEGSTYHAILPAQPSDPKPCNGTGYRVERPGGDGGNEGPGPGPGMGPLGGTFTPTTPPPFGDWPATALVQLADGRVYAHSYTKFAVYDPASRLWDPVVAPYQGIENSGGNAILLTDDPVTPVNDCAPRCGRVLVHTPFQFYLFDATSTGSSAWQRTGSWEDTQTYSSWFVNGMVLLKDDPATPDVVECAGHCGKVFFTAFEGSGDKAPMAQLYDPKADKFEAVYYPVGRERELANLWHLTALRDGRVQMVGVREQDQKWTAALFDPKTSGFTDAAVPPAAGVMRPSAVLPSGDVLFSAAKARSPIYQPSPAGPGQWSNITQRCVDETDLGCQVIASFPDGIVLVHVHNGASVPFAGNSSTGATRLFDPANQKWIASGPMASAQSAGPAVFVEPARGGCGTDCGKILVVGRSAEVYSRIAP